MPHPARHVFVCSQQRPPGHPRGSCAAKGASPLLQALWGELQKRQAYDQVAITYSGCLGPCEGGPNVLVYPEGVLYQGVTPADVPDIFEQHLLGGIPVERLVAPPAVW
ncbi:ferredoxin [Vitreoscilla filiformis]|uniref:Ferredoxin n=1 Tax=Vitreoscilla filiformis TaxID=63 RepID=A0A221KEH8_VITFI|nr:(2Fe-2S) ferredoxin domain-containing protein [Vitreoscilla filiformis]ASM77421.1 ferredoxin [Vitreoscilla filiformis]